MQVSKPGAIGLDLYLQASSSHGSVMAFPLRVERR